MKKMTLKSTVFVMSLFVLSCTTNEEKVIDKEAIVKELLVEFIENVKNSDEYIDFYSSKSNLQLKSASTHITEQEIQDLIKSLPSEFITLYNQVKDLDITEEEFMTIANKHNYLLNKNDNYLAKGKTPIPNSKACVVSTIITNIPACGGCFLGWIGRWVHC